MIWPLAIFHGVIAEPLTLSTLTVQTLKTEVAVWQRQAREQLLHHRRALVVVLVSAACLLLLEYYVIRGGFWQSIKPFVAPLFDSWQIAPKLQPHLGWAIGCVLAYTLLPVLTIKLMLRESLSSFGLQSAGYLRHLPLYLLLVSPVLISLFFVAQQPEFQHSYPFYIPRNGSELLLWELAYLAQFAALEFFFRGFIVHGVRPNFGGVGATLLMLLPYMMIHYAKPWMEATGAVVAGLILGGLSLATRSIWGGVTMHGLVAVSMDLLALYQRGWFAD